MGGEDRVPEDLAAELDGLLAVPTSGARGVPDGSACHDANAVLVASLDALAGPRGRPADRVDAALGVVHGSGVEVAPVLLAVEHQLRTIAGWCAAVGFRLRGADLLEHSPVSVSEELRSPVLALASILEHAIPYELARFEPQRLTTASATLLWAAAGTLSTLTGASLRTVATSLPGFGERPLDVPTPIVRPLVELHAEVAAQLSRWIDEGNLLVELQVALMRRNEPGQEAALEDTGLLGELPVRRPDRMDLTATWPMLETLVTSGTVSMGRGRPAPWETQALLTQFALGTEHRGVPITGAAALLTPIDDGTLTHPDGNLLLAVIGREVQVVTARPTERVGSALNRLPNRLLDRLLLASWDLTVPLVEEYQELLREHRRGNGELP